MTKPVILITPWVRELPTGLSPRTDLYTVGTEYVDRVMSAGGIPLIAGFVSDGDVWSLLARVDGVLLSGGEDVDDRRRDHLEHAVLGAALRLAMPVFGICRGLQIINVHCGGSLIQDLPNTSAHPASPEGEQRNSQHELHDAAPWVRDAFHDGLVVNSLHHQAVDRLGDGLRVDAHASDGVVEALSMRDGASFLRAVQWHPEKMPGRTGVWHSTRVLEPFIAASMRYRQNRESKALREEGQLS